MIEEAVVSRVLGTALQTGGDFAEEKHPRRAPSPDRLLIAGCQFPRQRQAFIAARAQAGVAAIEPAIDCGSRSRVLPADLGH